MLLWAGEKVLDSIASPQIAIRGKLLSPLLFDDCFLLEELQAIKDAATINKIPITAFLIMFSFYTFTFASSRAKIPDFKRLF